MKIFVALVGSFMLASASSAALAADKLVILSPHRKSIQDEFIPPFKEYYKKLFKSDVVVEWLDQGGTSDDIRFLRAKFAGNKESSGVDVFWGGGAINHQEIEREGLLSSYKLPKAIKDGFPMTMSGVPLYTDKQTWFGVAASSFGMFFNKKAMKMEGVPPPARWEDLGDARFVDQLSLADPRHSGTSSTMNIIVIKSLGWAKGMELLARISANVKKFEVSSSSPVKAVVAGDALASMVIDFYAYPKIAELGADNLGFVLPEGQTVLDTDPVAILKGAPNRKVAERFVDYLLSPEAQKLQVLPKGAQGGPKLETLARMSVLPGVYKELGSKVIVKNPFEQKGALKLEAEEIAGIEKPLRELIGVMFVDTHSDLKAAWKTIVKRGLKPEDLRELGKMPVEEKELVGLGKKWNDDLFRNKEINRWVEFARKKYAQLKSAN